MRNQGKQLAQIMSLPDNPDRPIIWVVYNEHMIDQVRNLIREVKGPDYMKYVRVISKSLSNKNSFPNEHYDTYIDPLVYDLLHNGYD